jgi:PDZ domain-containing protein
VGKPIRQRKYTIVILATIVIIAMNFVKLPYYLNMPGEAYVLSPIVMVEDGDKATGEFMMTTVGVSRGKINPFTYVWSQVVPHHELVPAKDMRVEGESDKEYYYRQLHAMDMSQNVAIAVAYEKANKHIEYKYNGVFVMSLLKGMDAENKLEVGDRIYKVNEDPLESSEQFIEMVGQLKEGDSVDLTLERNGEEVKKNILITPFPKQPQKVGVGISLVTDRDLEVEPDVKIDTSAVGGPSAGLMFTLEIYNQLTQGDLTKGYKIAGTGTINYNGIVGPIGGIEHKIVAADKAGAEYFLAPNEQSHPESNYNDAVKAAKEIGTTMKIIPVDTLDDALAFLESL